MRTSGNAPEHVAVVGAGMVGLATAWFLQQYGLRTTVVDRVGVAAGASWGNAGYLAPAFTVPLPEPSLLRRGLASLVDAQSPVVLPRLTEPRAWSFLARFATRCTSSRWRRSMRVFTDLNERSLEAYDQLADDGLPALTTAADPLLAVCSADEGRHGLIEEFTKVACAGGAVDYELVGGDELHRIEPALGPRARAGICVRGQRYIDPPEFVDSLARAVRERGGEIVGGFDVSEVHDTGTGVVLRTTGGQQRTADVVVLANGAWLNTLARPFGVREPVQAGRGYSFTIHPRPVPSHPLHFPEQRVACTPRRDSLRVTGTMEFRPADAPLDRRRIHAIVSSLRAMFRHADWDARYDEWVGARPCTTDGLPLVGATRSPRVHVAGGHGMWGIVLGPLTGKMLAERIATARAPEVLRHFDPLRRLGPLRRAPAT